MASRSVNFVVILGNLTADAETKSTPSGTTVSSFSVATNRRFKDQSGEWKDQPEFHRCVLWKSENVSNFLLKGKQIHITGHLQTRKWEDKNGVAKYSTEIVCEDLILLGGGPKGDEQPVSRPRGQSKPPAQQTSDFGGGIDESDCPF